MRKFEVQLRKESCLNYCIEAENESEAMDLAYAKAIEEGYSPCDGCALEVENFELIEGEK